MLKHYDPSTGKYTDAEKTLRDEFAMAALKGNLANPHDDLSPEQNAEIAYKIADAMMAAREGK